MSAVEGSRCEESATKGGAGAPASAEDAASAARSQAAWYVLVRSHTEGLGLYRQLRGAGFPVRIAPVPHGLQACCGMSVLVGEAEVDAVRAFMDRENCPYEDVVRVERAIDAGRDRFC